MSKKMLIVDVVLLCWLSLSKWWLRDYQQSSNKNSILGVFKEYLEPLNWNEDIFPVHE